MSCFILSQIYYTVWWTINWGMGCENQSGLKKTIKTNASNWTPWWGQFCCLNKTCGSFIFRCGISCLILFFLSVTILLVIGKSILWFISPFVPHNIWHRNDSWIPFYLAFRPWLLLILCNYFFMQGGFIS